MGDARAKGTIYGIVPISHYEIYTDGTNDVYWDDTTHYVVTVPADHNYLLWGGYVDIENAATLDITIKDASDNIIMYLTDEGAGAGAHHYPDPAICNVKMPIPLKEGWYVEVLFGAAQSTAAFASCVCTPVLLT